jgi:MFS family permease
VRSLGFNLYNISLPLVAEQLSESFILTGIAVGVFGITQTISQVPFGRLSDRYGRRNLMLISAVIYAFGSLMVCFSHTILEFIIYRSIQGVSALMSVIQACLGDVFPKEKRGTIMGWFSLIYGIGMIVGLPLGIILAGFFGLPMPFYIGAVLAAISAIILFLFLKETLPEKKIFVNKIKKNKNFAKIQEELLPKELLVQNVKYVENSTKNQDKSYRFVNILPSSFIIFLVNSIMGGFFAFAPLLLEYFGYTIIQMIIVFIPGIIIFFGGSIFSGMVSDKIGRKWPVLIGLFIGIPSAIFLAFTSNLIFFIVLILCLMFGISFINPPLSALVLDLVPEEKRGNASGTFNALSVLGSAIGASIMGFIVDSYGYNGIFGFASYVLGTCLILAFIFIKNVQHLKSNHEVKN